MAQKFADGTFTSPAGSRVAYMLSTGIRNFNPATGRVDSFPPHLML